MPTRTQILNFVKITGTLLVLLVLPLILQSNATKIYADSSTNQCTKSSCVAVCSNGKVIDKEKSQKSATQDCSKDSGLDLLANPGSDHCNQQVCHVVCGDGKKLDYDKVHDSSAPSCSGHGGVSITINQDDSTDADSSKKTTSANTTCDQSDAFSTCCATEANSQADCTEQYCQQNESNGTNNCSDPSASCTGSESTNQCDLVKKYLNPMIELLSACVGVVVVISLILGGIQYSTSEGDPQKVSAAKNRITKTIVALVAYTFLYALVQFLVPGGIGS